MHGGATHFPIALLMVSVIFDHAGFWWRNEVRRREFCAVGFYSLFIAAVSGAVAVVSGIALRPGDEIRIEGIPGGQERAPLDYVELHAVP